MEYKLIIGVDVSKLTLDLTGLKKDEKKHQHDSFLNKDLGYRKIGEWVSSFGISNSEVLVCMEHTGYYIFGLCNYLSKHGITYSVVNPLEIKRSMGVQRVKTDKKDSYLIAQYASKFTEELPMSKIPEKDLLQIKLLAAHRERILKHKLVIVKVVKELESTLEKAFIKSILKDNKKQMKLLEEQLKEVESRIHTLVKENSYLDKNYKLMQSVPGVGPQIALYVMLYTHNFERISTPRKFGSFAGVVPNAKRSGTSIRGRDRVSHLANKKMKSLLHFGALSAVQYDGELKSYYQRKVAEGKSKMSVLNAVRNKLVHRIYSVVRRGETYYNQPLINIKKELVLS